MRSLLLRSLLVALLIGPLVALASMVATVASGPDPVKYEPGITVDEFRSYDNRTVSDMKAFMKSREVKETRYQWLRTWIAEPYFWKETARKSVGPCLGIFLGCLVVGRLERRYTTPPMAGNRGDHSPQE